MNALSVVIPYYREPHWLPVILRDLAVAVERSTFEDVEVIVVDDGSPETAEQALSGDTTALPLRVIRQDNAGRFEARRTGFDAAEHDNVLLLDSRVSVEPDALRFLAEQLVDGAVVWNAHVHVALEGNPFARFWDILTEASYAHYFDDPRTTRFGLEDFDLFPKGTTCFVAPRQSLLDAYGAFTSKYEDLALANDDTPVIRFLAERHGVGISPRFACLYRSRDALRPFLRHVFHRGTVFVDGHAVRGGRFLPVIVAFYPLSVLAVGVTIRRPRLAAGLLGVLPFAAAALPVKRGRGAADVGAMAMLTVPWVLAFGAGIWRGLWLLLRSRRSRARAAS